VFDGGDLRLMQTFAQGHAQLQLPTQEFHQRALSDSPGDYRGTIFASTTQHGIERGDGESAGVDLRGVTLRTVSLQNRTHVAIENGRTAPEAESRLTASIASGQHRVGWVHYIPAVTTQSRISSGCRAVLRLCNAR
jgi:hypothetical protein